MERTDADTRHPKALVVEDEQAIRDLIRAYLGAAGFEVETCADGLAAIRRLSEEVFELVVLDVRLPGVDGVSVCRTVRKGGCNALAPIVMVSGCADETDTVLGLDSGADDYIGKPFGMREFLARVGAVTRRLRLQESAGLRPRVSRTAIRIDADKRCVVVRGERIELTRQEFNLLHRLVTRRGIVFSRSALLETVWRDDSRASERTVDSVISRLRGKIEVDARDPALILTEWGLGYKFAEA